MNCDRKPQVPSTAPSNPEGRHLRDYLRRLNGSAHRTPQNSPPDVPQHSSYGQMLLLFANKQYAEAEVVFRQLCATERANEDVFRLGAVNAWHYGQRYAAQLRIRRSLALAPDVVETLICAAEIFCICGLADEALTAAQRAVTLAPEYGAAHNSLGLAKLLDNRHDDAQRAFEVACSLDWHDLDARHNLSWLTTHRDGNEEVAGIYVGHASIVLQ